MSSLLLIALVSTAPRSAISAPRHEVLILAEFGFISQDYAFAGDFVFRDEASWCAFWAEASGTIFPEPPGPLPACPAVDFRREVVIATAAHGGGCDDFAIASVERVGSRRAVEVLVQHFFQIPGGSCRCTADFHVDARAVVVAKPIGDVEFVHEWIGTDCGTIVLTGS